MISLVKLIAIINHLMKYFENPYATAKINRQDNNHLYLLQQSLPLVIALGPLFL